MRKIRDEISFVSLLEKKRYLSGANTTSNNDPIIIIIVIGMMA